MYSLAKKFDEVIPNITNLQAYIDTHSIVNLEAKTYLIDAAIVIPNNVKICGIMGKTKIKASSAAITALFSFNNPENITIEGIEFEGYSANATVLADSLPDIKAKTGIGVQDGMYITGTCLSMVIDKCKFKNLTSSGINLYRLDSVDNGLKITNVFFDSCYIGLLVGVRSEFTEILNSSASNCNIGYWIEGGNTTLCNLNATHNQVGMVVSGLLNENDSHGMCSNGKFAHNTLYSILCTTIRYGFLFTACQIFNKYLWVDDSTGFSFIGGILGYYIVIDKGAEVSVGVSMVHSNAFVYSSASVIQYGEPLLSLKNNYYQGGQSNVDLNNTY